MKLFVVAPGGMLGRAWMELLQERGLPHLSGGRPGLDILDVASESDESGKTPGTDLKEGVPTLPVLMARASTDPADARLLELLDETLTLLRAHPAMDQARAYVIDQARRAKELLTALPEGSVRDALEAFADVIAVRSA